jgi:hypothetical protein
LESWKVGRLVPSRQGSNVQIKRNDGETKASHPLIFQFLIIHKSWDAVLANLNVKATAALY